MSPSTRFVTTRVRAAEPAGEGQVLLAVDSPPGLVDAHRRAGQWCELAVPGGEPAPYALYSTPDERRLVFIVKAGGDPGAEIAALRAGDAVDVAPPDGPGFDLARAEGRDVTFVATGTGIAPIRAAVESVLAQRAAFGALRVYYGVQDDRFVAVAADLARWRAAGIEVHVHRSRDAAGGGPRYVQDAVERDAPDPATTSFIVAGHPEIADALARYAAARGADAHGVIHNR